MTDTPVTSTWVSTKQLDAIDSTVTIRRDGYGIPTIEADTANDAWWGLGYAAAEDRLWQMEYDRRRATGRWAEIVGPPGVSADRLARKLQLTAAAMDDVAAMDSATRLTFECYADGINAFAADRSALPPEYEETGTPFEPWLSWHSVAAFKVRHVLMGVWQYKLVRSLLLAREGLAAFEEFDPVPQAGMLLTSPAGTRHPEADIDPQLLAEARSDIAAAAAELGFLAEVEAGSNAWAIAGSRTASGHALLVNDSHRAADVPNVYWQATLRCPDFGVSGGTFPGIPGFPHFGHNGQVGWAITNAAADAQDLINERFRSSGTHVEVLTVQDWVPAGHRREEIVVRGGPTETVDCFRTPNGPVVHGDPRAGAGLSLRWTATQEPCEQYGALTAMLKASSVEELLEAQRPWVDPVNNFLCADVDGNIGYLLRGTLPHRSRPSAVQMPIPGWEADAQWDGRVTFEDMPREINPSNGFLANANNTVVDTGAQVRVSHAVNDFYRAERIHELLQDSTAHTRDGVIAQQNDTVSIAARLWSTHVATRGPFRGAAELARHALVDWDGDLAAPRPAGLVYACFRRALAGDLVGMKLSESGRRLLLDGEIPAGAVLLKRWFAQLVWAAPGQRTAVEDLAEDVFERCLHRAWSAAEKVGGSDPAEWRWAPHHQLQPVHSLASSDVGDRFRSPAPVPVGGDSETIQAAAYGWRPDSSFTVTNCAVYRQVLDFSDLSAASWIIPGGASGRDDSRHYEDQLKVWGAGELVTMSGSHEGSPHDLA